jgi:hypothetical protein
VAPSNKLTQLHTQTLASFFVAFHDPQGYGEGILTSSTRDLRRVQINGITRPATYFPVGILLGFFGPDDEGGMFPRKGV